MQRAGDCADGARNIRSDSSARLITIVVNAIVAIIIHMRLFSDRKYGVYNDRPKIKKAFSVSLLFIFVMLFAVR